MKAVKNGGWPNGKTPRVPDAGQWSLKFSPAEPLACVLAVYRLSPGRIASETAVRSPTSGGSTPV